MGYEGMARIIEVEVNRPNYGKVELNISKIIAVVPQRRMLIFECVVWYLGQEDFDRVYKAWKR
jgi:hypothetical protein